MVIILPVPYIKDCAKLWAVPPGFSHPLRNTSRKKWEILLLRRERKRSERVRNTAPSARKKISAPVPHSGHKLRIARRRHCFWCEKHRAGAKEVRRKDKLSGIRRKPYSSEDRPFQRFSAPRNCYRFAFAPTEKIIAAIIIRQHNHRRSSEAMAPMPVSRQRKFPSSFFHMGAKKIAKHLPDCEVVAIFSSHPARKQPQLGSLGYERGLRNPLETL